MRRRTFLSHGIAAFALAGSARQSGTRLAQAAHAQLCVTTGYDPNYSKIAYPNGDVPRATGVCADVIVRAAQRTQRIDSDPSFRSILVYALLPVF
jgi:uncharacterized protein YijF (DUF1287 family)